MFYGSKIPTSSVECSRITSPTNNAALANKRTSNSSIPLTLAAARAFPCFVGPNIPACALLMVKAMSPNTTK